MLKKAKSFYVVQKAKTSIKKRNFATVYQRSLDADLNAYQNKSLLNKRWMRNLLTSMLIGFGGGVTLVLNHYIRYRIH